MSAFLTIVKLTFRNGMRSHLFQLLLLVLLLCVVAIPATISGDGTADGFIRVSLLYSLAAVSTVLALSSVWLGCFVMSQDIENYQLHMVVTKPVSRAKIWLAKWVGVNLINLLLLVVSSLAIYGLILYNFNRQEFSQEERQKMANEVMVGRRVFLPDRPDFSEESRKLVARKISDRQKQGIEVDTSPKAQEEMLSDARREVVSAYSEAKSNQRREFRFSNLPEKPDQPLYLRYRPYVGKVSSEKQRMTRVMLQAGVPRITGEAGKNASVFQTGPRGYEVTFLSLSQFPEQVMSGEFHEKVLLPEWKLITPDNEVLIAYINCDESQTSHFLQPSDGPMLLIRVTGFLENYLRAILVIAMELLILSGLACAFGGFLTLPTAVFVVISYLLFGSFAVYMSGLSYISGVADSIGQGIARVLLWVVIPLQAFEVTGVVANGELIEFSLIGRLFLSYFVYRALPWFLFGIYMYWRRELGLVIRK